MVFLSHRGAEQRHEAVAGKMRRRSAEAIHLGKARRQKRADEIAHRFGSQLFAQSRRADNVAKQHRDLFHFAESSVARYRARTD